MLSVQNVRELSIKGFSQIRGTNGRDEVSVLLPNSSKIPHLPVTKSISLEDRDDVIL